VERKASIRVKKVERKVVKEAKVSMVLMRKRKKSNNKITRDKMRRVKHKHKKKRKRVVTMKNLNFHSKLYTVNVSIKYRIKFSRVIKQINQLYDTYIFYYSLRCSS